MVLQGKPVKSKNHVPEIKGLKKFDSLRKIWDLTVVRILIATILLCM
jgi:hypothetical protein